MNDDAQSNDGARRVFPQIDLTNASYFFVRIADQSSIANSL
jgi:hypothetical protein